MVNGTEQPIPRPKNRTKRKIHYLGKKKRHTIKNQITINLNDEIMYKPPHSPRRRNNYDTFKTKYPKFSQDLLNFYDLGYLGISEIVCGIVNFKIK